MNTIRHFTVRQPGVAIPWLDEIKSERAAHEEAKLANRVIPGHKVYAKHQDGSVSGPYPAPEAAQ